jgi:protein SCO1/2
MRKALTLTAVTLLCAVVAGWTHAERLRQSGVRRVAATGLVFGMADSGRVRVAHDDIAGYMPAMTMAIALGPDETAAPAAGDRIRFTLRIGPDGTWMEGIAVTGHGPLPDGAGRLAAVDRLHRGDPLPPIALIDQDGRTVATEDLRGHPTVLTFIFTRCPVPEYCPLLSRRFTQLQAVLAGDDSPAADARLLSVTLDPAFDTPPVLAGYARSLGADRSRWRFAGGSPDDVMRLARAFSVYVERRGALLDHTLATALIDADGRVVEIWRGSGWKVSEVVEAVRTLPAHGH